MPSVAARVQQALDGKVFPGCVIGTIRANGSREILPFGALTYDGEPVSEHTVYDLASVTKSIPTASLTLQLMSAGAFSLGHTVKMFIPELQNDFGATIEDLLRYRVHGLALSKLRVHTFEELRAHTLERGFDGPPGESVYTNLPAFLLGMVLERVGGESIAALAQRHFFGPLAMDGTTFFPSVGDCAPTEVDLRGEVRGLPHDESAYLFAKARRTAGHAGLFSTASDLLTFTEALIAGAYPAIVEGAEYGFGWQREGDLFGSHPREHVFGKTGFTGTSLTVDIERRTALVILSNRTYPTRPADSFAINALRKDIADIVMQQ
jgi:CubicO group peptidase (beta-lactamase class C family)